MALWLLLAAATAAADVSCPEGYIASPNASFRYPCWHLSPPNYWDFDSGSSFSSSLAACVEQCAENNAVPACFSSMEEIDWVTEHVAALHQRGEQLRVERRTSST